MLICQKANYLTRMVKNRPCLFNWPLTYKKKVGITKTTSPIVSTLTNTLSGLLKRLLSCFLKNSVMPSRPFLPLVVMDYFRFEIIHVAETIQACKKSWLTKKSKTKKKFTSTFMLHKCSMMHIICIDFKFILNSGNWLWYWSI